MAAFEKTNSKVYEDSYLFGRDVLKSSLTEDELTPDNILGVLKDVLPAHFENRKEIDYLRNYYEGNQDILSKVKKVREDINNKVVENTAFHIIEFKKGFVFGDPIQYVQKTEASEKEIEKFNYYMAENGKPSLDSMLGEDFYLYGTAFRMIFPSNKENLPFQIFNAEPRNTNIVYSTGYENIPLFGFYITEKYDYSKDKKEVYYIVTVYTRKEVFVYKTNNKAFQNGTKLKIELIPEKNPNFQVNWQGEIPIIEYPLNKSRLGLVELVKSMLDTLNKISSNDIDGIDQFIQSLLIFMNVDIDRKDFIEMVAAGAIKLKSIESGNNNAKSDIKSVVNQLQHSETKILWDRIYNTLLSIAGVPRMSDKASSGDTGQARLVGEGWTMADQRAKQDELAFKLSEKELIKRALNICKNKVGTDIKKLNANDINIKFTRNKSDNILTKTQALMNLKAAQINPDIAIATVDLFSDPNEVYKLSAAFYGEDFWNIIKPVTPDKNVTSDVNTKDVVKPVTV